MTPKPMTQPMTPKAESTFPGSAKGDAKVDMEEGDTRAGGSEDTGGSEGTGGVPSSGTGGSEDTTPPKAAATAEDKINQKVYYEDVPAFEAQVSMTLIEDKPIVATLRRRAPKSAPSRRERVTDEAVHLFPWLLRAPLVIL